MPLFVAPKLPSIFVLKSAFEANGLTRSEVDSTFNLTDAEFQVENELIVIGPLANEDMIPQLFEFLEQRGLVYYENFFELSGNWPDWLSIYARGNNR